jgi:16S rRNA (cytosine1402-N4)-methyltransferase
MPHLPVMLTEVIEQLAIHPDGYYVDCTFGRGGHSKAILDSLSTKGRLIALDRDLEAINSDTAQVLLLDSRFNLRHCSFSKLKETLTEDGQIQQVDGILMDLGVSSPQLDTAERGFSFLKEGPLDMRMNKQAGISAQEWLAKVPEQQLVKVLFEYGEERFARRIARAVIEARAVKSITTTRELVQLIEQAIPVKEKHKHPATRTFQAIRIEINQELEELKIALRQVIDILKPGGRLAVITFHSLEDRIVKRFISHESGVLFHPGKLPIKEIDIARGSFKKIGKAIRANPDEIQSNARARSATLRVAEKIR